MTGHRHRSPVGNQAPARGGHRFEEPSIDAFLLLKPDCLRLGLTGHVERVVEAAGLRVDGRFGVTLTPADVRALWAEYDDAGHRLTLAFLDRYLTTAPSEVLLVSGPDAFEAARRVKRKIRGMFANGPYANVVHAAEQRDELTRQRAHLVNATEKLAGKEKSGGEEKSVGEEKPEGKEKSGGTGNSADEGNPPGKGKVEPGGSGKAANGTVARRPPGDVPFDVTAVVGEVWPLIQGIPADPGPVRLDDGERAVFLAPDREHTLDSTVTALCHALPGTPARQIVLLALHAGFSGGEAIAIGSRSAVRRGVRALRERGIRNCWTDRWQPPTTPAPRFVSVPLEPLG
ncbi:nucleoside-diphosphate kinase [Actinoplanes couchii]|uniref:Nucleoside diphosphate kinase-like domain-containing protein n=1 Tax=Actinoplanes couchii TaxID=403638 RepID=A0ABQ3X1G8_9ACTN|nr:nucleoside-diphosphate kinase [Actinoplanes couchii]MDR6316770.1 nucleoside diphosphate kinase [Actinoplanes couchii]GID52378.1 hypothetical protein Aco03nite_007820 [Actinoplanes couchii]